MKKLNYLLLLISVSILITTGCKKDKEKEEEEEVPVPVNTVSDIDGNTYHTVTLGTQTWMVENLKVTKLNDGTPITHASENSTWENLGTAPGYCWYNNSSSYKDKFGALYNWYAVNTGKLAPNGWHVPTDAEWTVLENYLIANGFNYDGTTTDNKIAKSMASTTDWQASTVAGAPGNSDFSAYRNKSGFTAYPSGDRNYRGVFYDIGWYSTWWSSTVSNVYTAWGRDIGSTRVKLLRDDYTKEEGYSVRCIKD